jgi:hypothetical protein
VGSTQLFAAVLMLFDAGGGMFIGKRKRRYSSNTDGGDYFSAQEKSYKAKSQTQLQPQPPKNADHGANIAVSAAQQGAVTVSEEDIKNKPEQVNLDSANTEGKNAPTTLLPTPIPIPAPPLPPAPTLTLPPAPKPQARNRVPRRSSASLPPDLTCRKGRAYTCPADLLWDAMRWFRYNVPRLSCSHLVVYGTTYYIPLTKY